MKILIVDDDADIRAVVAFALNKAGHQTLEASNGLQGLTMAHTHSPDLIILDILMPEMDGTEVCTRLRRRSNVPIIFLTSRDDEVDRILGLELGGDDYITKPFSPRELAARVKAIGRRLERQSAPEDTSADKAQDIKHGRLTLDPVRFKVFWDQTEVSLTVTEFGVLQTLLGYPGKVFTRDELISKAYRDQTIVSDRTIDSHITRIRRKFAALGATPIETVHGLGYKCGDCLG